jgi:hypothetical protein
LHAAPNLGFNHKPASTVAQAIIDGIESKSLEVIHEGEVREAIIAQNRENHLALDDRFALLKAEFENAVKDLPPYNEAI